MAKKHDTDYRAALLKRVGDIASLLAVLLTELLGCVNEKAHLRQYYKGRIEQAEAELAYLKALLEG